LTNIKGNLLIRFGGDLIIAPEKEEEKKKKEKT
jgi:hypothetical protein